MLLDTTVFVDFLRGEQEVKQFLEKEKKLSTSIIVVMEISAGFKKKQEIKKFEKFLKQGLIRVYHLDQRISQLAFELFKSYFHSDSLGIADALIAATAMVHKEKLKTANLRHFRRVKNLRVQKL